MCCCIAATLISGGGYAEDDVPQVECSAPWLADDSGRNNVERRSLYEQFQRDVRVANTQLPRMHSCIIPLKKLPNIKPYVLVDVRKAEDFAAYAMPGAINIDVNAISTRRFLKNQALVLMDYGYRYDELTYMCDDLRFDGFESVYIVKDGIAAWLRQTYDTDQQLPLGGAGLPVISAKAFIVAPGKNRWVIMDFSGSESHQQENLVQVDASLDDSKIQKRVASEIASFTKANKTQPNILLVDKNAELVKRWESLVPKSVYMHAYILRGGIHAYEAYVDKYVAMLKQKQRMSERRSPGCG